MCWKKIFGGGVTPEPIEANKILLSFAINNYPGSGNDLNGCINDQINISGKLADFYVRCFKDSEVTKARFTTEVEAVITQAKAGDVIVIHYSGHGTYVTDTSGDEPDNADEAIYLYDGALIDDKINEILQKTPAGVTVVILLDSCFSGTATRKLSRPRFIQTERALPGKVRRKFLRSNEIKWIVYSGCSEHQTSADAYIGGKYNGAFTYYAMKALDRSLSYEQWYNKIREYLPSKSFEQIPTLEGPADLLTKIVFT